MAKRMLQLNNHIIYKTTPMFEKYHVIKRSTNEKVACDLSYDDAILFCKQQSVTPDNIPLGDSVLSLTESPKPEFIEVEINLYSSEPAANIETTPKTVYENTGIEGDSENTGVEDVWRSTTLEPTATCKGISQDDIPEEEPTSDSKDISNDSAEEPESLEASLPDTGLFGVPDYPAYTPSDKARKTPYLSIIRKQGRFIKNGYDFDSTGYNKLLSQNVIVFGTASILSAIAFDWHYAFKGFKSNAIKKTDIQSHTFFKLRQISTSSIIALMYIDDFISSEKLKDTAIFEEYINNIERFVYDCDELVVEELRKKIDALELDAKLDAIYTHIQMRIVDLESTYMVYRRSAFENLSETRRALIRLTMDALICMYFIHTTPTK